MDTQPTHRTGNDSSLEGRHPPAIVWGNPCVWRCLRRYGKPVTWYSQFYGVFGVVVEVNTNQLVNTVALHSRDAMAGREKASARRTPGVEAGESPATPLRLPPVGTFPTEGRGFHPLAWTGSLVNRMWIYLGATAIPLGVTLALTLWIRSYATTHRLFDWPGGRKVHDAPKPRLGGIAIYVGFTSTVLTGFALAPWLATIPAIKTALPQTMAALAGVWAVKSPLIGLLLGGTIMFLVGLMDDLLGERFPTHWKFAGQTLAAIVAVACGVRVDFAGNDVTNFVLSVLWIVGISNAFNLLDNMDGLTAGVAAVSSAVFLINAAELGEIFICFILAALIGSLVGFLRFNFPPASLFMGDSGALFIGFTLSSLTILERYVTTASSSLFPILMPLLVLAVPLLDTISVIYIRILERRPIYIGDRCHLSHPPRALRPHRAAGGDLSLPRDLWTRVGSAPPGGRAPDPKRVDRVGLGAAGRPGALGHSVRRRAPKRADFPNFRRQGRDNP